MFKKKIVLFGCLIFIVLIFICIVILWNSFLLRQHYATEIATVYKQKGFKISNGAIQMPLGKFLLIKPNSYKHRLYLFKIVDFHPMGFLYKGALLEKTQDDNYNVIKTTEGKIQFYRFYPSVRNLFGECRITISPVNNIIRRYICSYAYLKEDNINIENKTIDLPEDNVIWCKKSINVPSGYQTSPPKPTKE